MLALLRGWRRLRFARRSGVACTGSARPGILRVMDPIGPVVRSKDGLGPGKCRAHLIWVNERSNPQVMERFAAFRLQEVFRRPP